MAAAQTAQAAAQAAQTVGRRPRPARLGRRSAPSVPTAPPPPVPAGCRRGGPGGREPDRRPLRLGRRDTPAGFDCSGLVQWSYAQVGISLPRTSGAQYDATTHIPLADIEPGDLLFYGPGGSEHVAMYVGGGR